MRVAIFPVVCLLGVHCVGSIGGDAGEDGDGDGAKVDVNDPEKKPELVGTKCAESLDVGLTHLQRLTRTQYKNAVEDLFLVKSDATRALPEDEKVGKAFDANSVAPVDTLIVEAYQSVAEELAKAARPNIDAILDCDVALDGEDACARQMLERVGRRAFRSPVTLEDMEDFLLLYAQKKESDGFYDALQLTIQALLQSPRFLYQIELTPPEPGAKIAVLNDYEVAGRLALFLTHSVPDEELLTAAEMGELIDPAGIRRQAERLIETPRGREVMASFHTQWLGLEGVESATKSPETYPEFNAALALSAKTETEVFIDDVMYSGDATLTTLLTAPYSFVDDKLASLYEIELPAGTPAGEFVKVTLPESERLGILTQASFLSSHAHHDQASPIKRGVFILRNVMCAPLADPPDDVDTKVPEVDPNASVRDRVDAATSADTCKGCHSLINPIGHGFSAYDGIGRRQELELGEPVNESGSVLGKPFAGPVELTELLATNPEVSGCVVSQWFQFALGRPSTLEDECTVDTLKSSFRASGTHVKQLLVDVATSDAFRLRRAEVK